MSRKTIGLGLMEIGAVVLVLALGIDLVGYGYPGIHLEQTLALVFGVLAFIIGFFLWRIREKVR